MEVNSKKGTVTRGVIATTTNLLLEPESCIGEGGGNRVSKLVTESFATVILI